MKTHEVANALELLAEILRRGPDQQLDEFAFSRSRREKPDPSTIPMALSTLLALSDFDKAQWRKLIADYSFPIMIRDRDASRDVIGKLLNYLESNPEARRRLSQGAQKSRPATSPELMRALQLLLKNDATDGA